MSKTIVETTLTFPQASQDRLDYGKVLVIAPSGYGKTYLAKTANKETTGFINAERKPLPFKEKFLRMGCPKSWASFMKNLEDYGEDTSLKYLIIDSQSMAFEMLHADMKSVYKGFDVYSNYNKEVTKYFDLLRNINKDIIVLSHDETIVEQGYKQRKAKVHGKEFEGRIEAYFTVVLFGDKKLKDGKPTYFLRTFQEDTSTKVPEDLFGYNLEIPNDAEYIFQSLANYYV